MLSVYARHYPACQQTDIYFKRCHCPKWIAGQLDGMGRLRRSAKTRTWAAALLKARRLEREDSCTGPVDTLKWSCDQGCGIP